MKNIFGIVLIIFSLTVFGFRIAKKIQFEQNVTGYLKHAGDANTIDLAEEELTKVVNFLEANNMTKGYTSIIWETPDEDIGFWYRNLKASQQELQNLEATTPLERTNVLIKLRETLLDQGEKTHVTVPDGLAVYPNNALWAGLNFAAFIAIFVGIGLVIPKEAWEHKA